MNASLLKQAVAAVGPEAVYATLNERQRESLRYIWEAFARPEQLEPTGDWNTLLVLAGRGAGKSRTGAEMVRKWAGQYPGCKMALVARTAADVRDVMLDALMTPWRGGLLDEIPIWEPSKRMVRWQNGSFAITYSAEEPNALRGPQHDFFWADELAAWQYPDEAWHEGLKMGMRGSGQPGVLIDRPRGIATTTPRPIALIRQLIKLPSTRVVRGSTFDNADNLPAQYIAEMQARYGGTRLGRQELYAEILDDVEGALWNHAIIEKTRRATAPTVYRRVVVAVDPSGSAKRTADEAGIVVAGLAECSCLGRPDMHAFVLEDLTGRYSPRDMGTKAIAAYHRHNADRLVAEDNFGGQIVADLVALIDQQVAYKAVHASRGKLVRAEPVAALYEQGRVHHVGIFPGLEDEMTMYAPLVSTESPGRLDAMVWAVTELMLSFPVTLGEAPVVSGVRRGDEKPQTTDEQDDAEDEAPRAARGSRW